MRLSTCAILLAVCAVALAVPAKKIIGVGCEKGKDCTGIGTIKLGADKPKPSGSDTSILGVGCVEGEKCTGIGTINADAPIVGVGCVEGEDCTGIGAVNVLPKGPGQDAPSRPILGVGCVEGEDCTGIGTINADDAKLLEKNETLNATTFPLKFDDHFNHWRPHHFDHWRPRHFDPWFFPRFHHVPRWCRFRWYWRPCRFGFDDPKPDFKPEVTAGEIAEEKVVDPLPDEEADKIKAAPLTPVDDHFHWHGHDRHHYFWRHRWFARCFGRWGWGPCFYGWDDLKPAMPGMPEKPLEDEPSCKGKEDGAYAMGCTRYFFVCLKEAAIKSECPVGMTFNAINISCDFFNADIPECMEQLPNNATTTLPEMTTPEMTTILPTTTL